MSKYGYREIDVQVIAPSDERVTVEFRWAQLLVLARMTQDVARKYRSVGFDIFADEALDYSRQLRDLAEQVEPPGVREDDLAKV